ncbi:MAG: TRAP transporter small permease subunit [Methyloligellaceae bacterium]
MTQQSSNVWLGAGRKPVYFLALLCTLTFVGMAALLIVGYLLFDVEIKLRQLLAPGNNQYVLATMIAGTLSLFFTSVYLSDFQGKIEHKPTGFFDIISIVLARMTMIAIVVIVSVMFFEVIARYLFVKPTLWANELSLWIAGFVFMLSGLYSMQQRSHIRIYIIYDMFPRWLQKASDIFSVFLLWIFVTALIWGGYEEALSKFLNWETFGTAWDPPIPATIKPGILIITVLVAMQGVSNLITDWNKAPEIHTTADDIDETEIKHIRQIVRD